MASGGFADPDQGGRDREPDWASGSSRRGCAGDARIRVVRDTVEISDSTLSKQVSALADVGYVHVRKGHVGKRPRTWLSLTDLGQRRFTRHVATLQEIAARAASVE